MQQSAITQGEPGMPVPANALPGRAVRFLPVPRWFAAALGAMLVMELSRLAQTNAAGWIACDYAGRIAALALLAAVPAARAVAFRRETPRISAPEILMWVAGIVAFDVIVDHALSARITAAWPGTRIAQIPHARGWLFGLDTSLGLLLVAYTEEVIFRRCGRAVLRRVLGDGPAMIAATSMLFAAYHWWTGIGNIVATLSFGIVAMLCYRRSGALTPVVAGHYLCDVANFA